MRAVTGALVWDGHAFVDDAAIVIDGDRVSEVVERAEVAALDDWGDVAILPGTVNAHGHAFQSLFKGFGDDLPFSSWRDDVLYPFSEELSGEDVYWGALFAFAEALLAGITTTVDFFYLHDEGNDNAEQVIRAARDAGIRLVFARAFYDVDAPTKAPRRYREPATLAAERFHELAGKYAGDPLVSVQPAPHSLHAVSLETIAVALEAAARRDVPCHLHLAEAEYEIEMIQERYGSTPVRLLAHEGLLDRRLVAVHGVWLDDEELDLLAGSGAALVHCPGANAFLGDGIARLPEMLRRQIRVALGPDGGCANNRQSVFDEMRLASLLAKARLRDGAAVGAPEALRLGTVTGGDVLGLPVGTLEPGSFADLVALDLNDLSLQPRAALAFHLVHSMQPTAIDRVMVGGETVVQQGKLSRVDAAEVGARVGEIAAAWARPQQGS